MTDPVIVCSKNSPLGYRASYERSALQKWIETNKQEVLYVSNGVPKRMIADWPLLNQHSKKVSISSKNRGAGCLDVDPKGL